MRILLTNDDGIFSPSLAAMARVLRKLGEVTIAAPASEQSGVGQGITFLSPLTLKEYYREGAFWGWAVEGTPVDCVKIGVAELCSERPDLIVSGMNNGLNAGANVLYSGTVAAALEGAFLGITSIAVSHQYSEKHDDVLIERVADVALEIIRALLDQTTAPGELFNVNIPFAAVRAQPEERKVVMVPVDRSPYWEEYEKRHDPTGRRYYWLNGRPNYKKIADEPTDFGVVSHGGIAITPLDFDLTKRQTLEKMKSWRFPFAETPEKSSETESSNVRLYRLIDRKKE